jgi:thiol:disulfide interchange protein
MSVFFRSLLSAAVALTVTTTAWGQRGKDSSPKAKVELFASADGVAPAQAFELALHFKLVPGWHIYWQNSGESGQAPRVKWTAPDGFRIGAFQYPVPKRHVDPSGFITTNILEDDPTLLIPVTAPASLKGQSVTIIGAVRYLICQELCIQETADVKVTIPVRSDPSEVKPTNERVFGEAHKRRPAGESKHVRIRAETKPPADKLKHKDSFELLIRVDVSKGYALGAHQSGSEKLAPTDLFVERIEGVYWDPIEFPEGSIQEIKGVGRVSVFRESLTIRVPGEIDVEAKPPFRFGGVLTFQACNDRGECSPPEAVEFHHGVAAENATVAPVAGEQRSDAAAPDDQPPVAEGSVDGGKSFMDRYGLVGLLIACFVYGLFINATPCVLPLLSIKVLGFVQQAHENRRRTLVLGLTFGAGVVVFFVILGFLASVGTNVLQYPVAVIALGTIVTALALSMLGVYTLHLPSAALAVEARISHESLAGSLGKGMLAPVLGFACTGPLLAGAFGWATQQPAHIALFAFIFAGLGMASPYMLLGANPQWLSFMPKPGPWMITFERIMGFLLLGMVVWLLHPLSVQIGIGGLEWTLAFLIAVAMACWILGKVNILMPTAQRWRYRAGAGALILVSMFLIYGWAYPLGEAKQRVAYEAALRASGAVATDWSNGIPWRPWSPEAVEEAVRTGHTVFVDFTAATCTQCKVNKIVAINTLEAREKMRDLGIVPYQGDFTVGDPEIFAFLKKFGQVGVPLNLIYPAGQPRKPIVLDTVLTKDYLLEKLAEAGPSRGSTTLATTGAAATNTP